MLLWRESLNLVGFARIALSVVGVLILNLFPGASIH
jgi:multidrug transporter EmrE-like cation transporter